MAALFLAHQTVQYYNKRTVFYDLLTVPSLSQQNNLFSWGYTDGSGSSGVTYKLGVKRAIEQTNPAIFLFENVVDVANRPRGKDGEETPLRPVEAMSFYSAAKTVQLEY